MIDKLIEGRLVTLIVGSVFRIVEIFVRAIHITVRGLRLLVQEAVTSRIDDKISRFGKRLVAKRTPVDGSSIVLLDRSGEYDGDPKYIAEEILRRGKPYTITWVLRPQSVGPFPRQFRFVRYGTADYFRAIARARVVIQNGRSLQDSGAVKSADQHWLQTSAGAIGDDSLPSAGGARIATALGHPKNDLLVGTPQQIRDVLRKKVIDRLGITDTGQRFLLYGPSPRNDGTVSLSGLDVAAVRAALSERFGGRWDILIRTQVAGKAESEMVLAGLPAYCRNASTYPDMQELLVVAEAALTDHARWIYDFVLTDKPAFGIALRPQATDRDPAKIPFTVATSNQELLGHIEHFDQDAYHRSVGRFLATSGSIDDGRSASRIVDEIEELMA